MAALGRRLDEMSAVVEQDDDLSSNEEAPLDENFPLAGHGDYREHDEQDASDAESELASSWKPESCKEEEEGWKKIVLERKGRTEYFLEPCVGVCVPHLFELSFVSGKPTTRSISSDHEVLRK